MSDLSIQTANPPQRWVVAVVHPQQHLKALQDLIQNGFEYFFPQVKRTVRHKGKKIHRLDPLLGVYILVALHDSWESIQDAWRAVIDLRRVSGLLMMDDQPSYVSPREMQTLKSQCTPEGIYVAPPKPRFHPGQRVKVGAGAFMGEAGNFVRAYRKKDEVRAKVSFGLGEADVKISDLVAA